MIETNWLYGINYESAFAVLEDDPERFEKALDSRRSIHIENITNKAQFTTLKSLIEPYNIGFGFNTFKIYSDIHFDLAMASTSLSGDGGTLTTEWATNLEADIHGCEQILLLNLICDNFLSHGSAWVDANLDDLEIIPELYKPSFTTIHPSVFKQAVFQSILGYYWAGQTGLNTDKITDFLSEIQMLLPDYQADTYFIRSSVLGEERYDFYACYAQTSPWFRYFPYQTTFFVIDRKMKQVHTFIFAQNND